MENEKQSTKRRAPLPYSADEAEDQLVSLAVNLAMERLQDGTASNQLIAEVLKLGTAKERLQKEKLRKENELLAAKTESIRAQQSSEEFQARVLRSLHSYAPTIYTIDEDSDYDE